MPQYVLDYVPYVCLDQNESYWPGDMTKHPIHTTPELGDTPMQEMLQTTLNLINCDKFLDYRGEGLGDLRRFWVFLLQFQPWQ